MAKATRPSPSSSPLYFTLPSHALAPNPPTAPSPEPHTDLSAQSFGPAHIKSFSIVSTRSCKKLSADSVMFFVPGQIKNSKAIYISYKVLCVTAGNPTAAECLRCGCYHTHHMAGR